MSQPDIELAMRRLAAKTEHPKALPDARLIWQRAALLPQWERYDSATRIVHLAEQAAGILSGAVGLAALITLLPSLAAALRATDQTLVRLGATALCATAVIAFILARELFAEE
jgi:hypothetical protein